MKPNFLVIGAQKCGTSTLCDLLARHPDVFMTDPKEPHFFSDDAVYARGLDWYARLFEGAEGHAAIGEGSTSYTMSALRPHAAERIARTLPSARLVYIVRHPMERIVSHWMHARTRGRRESLPLADAIRRRSMYLDTSRYLSQIDRYRRSFSDDRILVLFLDDLSRDRIPTLRRCFEFLGVDSGPAEAIEAQRLNASAGAREDKPVLTRLRSIPGFGRLRDAIPSWARDPLRSALKRPADKPEWDPESWRWAAERLEEESRAFLVRYGKPPDYWSFRFPASGARTPPPPAEARPSDLPTSI